MKERERERMAGEREKCISSERQTKTLIELSEADSLSLSGLKATSEWLFIHIQGYYYAYYVFMLRLGY